jgi:hypothetical protein
MKSPRNSYIFVFAAVERYLPNHCLATLEKGVHTYRHRLMGGMYEVCHSDGLRCHDIHRTSNL